jgi:hypothetical protein
MSDNRPSPPPNGGEYECVDPILGSELWRLADPSCPDELRDRLETHVAFCADCRLQLAVDRKAVEILRDEGLVDLPQPVASGRSGDKLSGWTTGVGATALAAGLALLLLLPPGAPHESLTLRGDDGPVIERPVADEVVFGREPTLRWTPLPGATRYNVQIEAVAGDYRWSTMTETPTASVPHDRALPPESRFRISVAAIPAHVAPDGALRSSFRTGGAGAWLAHRLRHGAAAARALGGLGLLGMLAGVAGLIRWQRPS